MFEPATTFAAFHPACSSKPTAEETTPFALITSKLCTQVAEGVTLGPIKLFQMLARWQMCPCVYMGVCVLRIMLKKSSYVERTQDLPW